MKPSSKSSSSSSNKFIPKLKTHLKIDISNLDYQSLEHEAKILHLILYRNNNQHRSWPWWKYLELVYKRTIQLVDTIKEQKQLEKKVPLNKKHVPLNKRFKKQQQPSSSYSSSSTKNNNKNSKNKKSTTFVEMDNKEYWKKLVKRYEHFIKTKQSSSSASSELKETNNDNNNNNKKYIPPGTLVRTNRCYNHSIFLFNKLIPKACRAFYSIIILGHFITLGFALIGAISRIHSILDTILSTYETEFNNSLDDLSKTISSSSSTDNKSKIQFNLLWKEQEKLTRKLLAANKEKKGLLLNNSIGLDENLQALSNNNTSILKENGLEEINPDEDFGEKVSIEDLSLFLNNDDEPTTTAEPTEPDNNNNNSTTENDDDNNNTIDNKLIPKKRTISDVTTNTSTKSLSPSSPSSPKTKIIKIDSVSSSPNNKKQQEKQQKKKSKNKSSKSNSNNTIDDIFGNLLSDTSSSTASKKSKDSSTNKKKKKKSKNSIDDIFNQF